MEETRTETAILTRSFPAALAEIDDFCHEARRRGEACGLGSQDLFALDLLLREALVNAVVHGSRKDPSKIVRCRLRIEGRRLRIEVADEGPGFDWRKAMARPGDSSADSGRGLGIFALYATKFTFNGKGNRLTIERDLRRGDDDA